MQDSRYEFLDIHEIQFDKTNPRIQRALDTYHGGEINSLRIALALREGSSEHDNDTTSNTTTYDRLHTSIKNQGVISPIIVKEQNGQYICVEGNTRLLIYRELSKTTGEERWKTISCRIFKKVTLEEIDAIRLQAHLVGPRPWDPYSKARYIAYLWNEKHMSNEKIIEHCGGNKKQIRDSLAAYNMVEYIYKPTLNNPEDFDHTRFSGFVEYQDSRVCNSVYEAGYTDKDFATWLHNKKISPLQHVRSLPNILKNDEAKQVFLRQDSSAALKVLNQPSLDELMRKFDIREILEAVRQKVARLGYEDVVAYKDQADRLIAVVSETVDVLQEFKNDLIE